MPSLNKVLLMGNLTRDPELRYLASGSPVCEFGMAVGRKWKGKDGKDHDETCFVDVTMWGSRGERVAEYFSKGKPIFIEGRLTYETWEGKGGSKRSKLKVTADKFEFLGGRDDDAAPNGQPKSRPSVGDDDPDCPF